MFIDIFNKIGNSFYYSVIYEQRYEYILKGLANTLLISFFAVIIGIILGILLGLIRNYNEKTGKQKFLSTIAKGYINIIRGTPVMLQLMIIYYVIFKTVDINIVLVGIIAFGLNSGAYVAEIIRGGLNSVPEGQIDAGYSLGLNYFQTFRYIVFPQSMKSVLPALGNEFVSLIKETSVGAYIGIIELTKASDIIASRTYEYFFPLIIIAIIYLILTIGLSKLINKLEKRASND